MAARIMTEAKGKERRQAARAAGRFPMAVTESGAVIEASSGNLSTAGVYCTLDSFVAPMSKLEIKFELPVGSRTAKIKCTGVVVRVEPLVSNAEQGKYNVGIFFTDLSDRDRSQIDRFVRERLKISPSA